MKNSRSQEKGERRLGALLSGVPKLVLQTHKGTMAWSVLKERTLCKPMCYLTQSVRWGLSCPPFERRPS